MNSLWRDNIAQMMSGSHRSADNPVYLCDLGAALTSAEPSEIQPVLEETDVSSNKLI